MQQNEQKQDFGQLIVSALINFFYMLAYILFLCPFGFWKKSAIRLDEARRNRTWDFTNTTSSWPFLSFLKSILLNFCFDGAIFISYFLGIIAGIYVLIDSGFMPFLGTIIGAYYAPMIISPLRDLFVILIMPFSKFLSWCSRPAQYLEIDMNKKDPK